MAKQITYQLICACFLCRKRKRVTIPEGVEPCEWHCGRKMQIEQSWPEEGPRKAVDE